MGLIHVAEVLTGANTEKIRKWNHHRLSTYGIGTERSRPEWAAIGRELIRLGYLRQTAERFSVLALTAEGLAVLRQRTPVTLTRPMAVPETMARRVGEISCDEVLFERLRTLRKSLADERDVPAYIVFSDVALRQMARNYPATRREFAGISGVGVRKLREFGAVFLAEIAAHLRMSPRQIFADDSFDLPAQPPRRRLGDSARETLRQFCAAATVEEIAARRRLVSGTICSHLTEAIERGEAVKLGQFFTDAERQKVAAAFERNGFGNLSGVFEALGGAVDYGRLRIYRAAMNSRGTGA